MSIVGTPYPLCFAGIGARPDRPHGLVASLSPAMVKAWRAAVLALLSTCGVACEDTTEPLATNEPPATATSPAADTRALVRREWITQHDKIAPELWLASRVAGADVPISHPSVSDMRIVLSAAHERFGDPSRMIANRAVQLETMLKEKGIAEPAPELIKSLTEAAGTIRGNEGFGAICQKYFILREQGVTREQALANLAAKV